MTTIPTAQVRGSRTRYLHGADEFVVVELAESMSLGVNVRAMAITGRLREMQLPGVIDICPANASYMLRFDPDRLAPSDLVAELRRVEEDIGDAAEFHLNTRAVDVPVLYKDPWTAETVMRFRDRHQRPEGDDLEYAAVINGFESEQAFIDAHCGAPYLVSMCGFVPTVPWCYQLVEQDRQIEVPKYVRPRTDTPERAFAHGGAFAAIYPVRGAGGYQLFGMVAAPIFQREQTLVDFAESMSFPRPGDIFNFRRIERDEYDAIRAAVDEGTFEYNKCELDFAPTAFAADSAGTREQILGRLYGDSRP